MTNQSRSHLSPQEKLELLGYLPDSRLLIINGDDLGMCHAVNAATFDALEHGLLTSASLMMPCPWSYAAATHLRDHPDLDVGVHLTLTSEWPLYRWGPLLGAARCPSLVDQWGYFHLSETVAWERDDPAEGMAEAEAQIQRAADLGLEPTHLDGHMGTFYAEARFLALYVQLALRHRLPLRMAPRTIFEQRGALAVHDALPLRTILTIDDLRFVPLRNPPALQAELLETLRTLQPGITELCVHVAATTPESRAFLGDWEARAEALRLLTASAEIRDAIEQGGIQLVGWRDLREAQRHSV